MGNAQKEIIKELGVKSSINSRQEIRCRIDFLKEYCRKANAKGFVLGISGGQDSTLAGRLAQIAANELREEGYEAKFVALRLPYGVQSDEDDADLALEFIKPDETFEFNIQSTVFAFEMQYAVQTDARLCDFHKGNVKARTRMMAQYAFGGERNLLVVGTDHAAESLTGFFTKFGDGSADMMPLIGLNKCQGKDLLKELGAAERLYMKVATADLLDSNPLQSDEIELSITYDEIDDYLEGKSVGNEVAEKIEQHYALTRHKRELPVTPSDTWWK